MSSNLIKIEDIVNQTIKGTGDSDKHALTLAGLVISINAQNVLELGVRNLNTTKPLLYGVQNTLGTLISVDINDCPNKINHPRWEFINSEAKEFLKNEVKYGVTYDLIYVDDWHSYEHVKEELEYIDKLVKPGSLVVLHDLMYGETCPYYHIDLTDKTGQWANGGPYRAVAELNPQFWEFSTVPANNGLTILRKKYTSLYKR